ncbi:MAG: hypothetical protein Edafosvirus2_101, partial [Edafosvirus sp.]
MIIFDKLLKNKCELNYVYENGQTCLMNLIESNFCTSVFKMMDIKKCDLY